MIKEEISTIICNMFVEKCYWSTINNDVTPNGKRLMKYFSNNDTE